MLGLHCHSIFPADRYVAFTLHEAVSSLAMSSNFGTLWRTTALHGAAHWYGSGLHMRSIRTVQLSLWMVQSAPGLNSPE